MSMMSGYDWRAQRIRFVLPALLAGIGACTDAVPTGAPESGPANLSWMIDGTPGTATVAAQLGAERIASLRIASDIGNAPSRIEITTAAAAINGLSEVVGADSTVRFAGVVLVDGVVASAEEVARLAEGAVARIELLQGDAARAVSPLPAAVAGVIAITTKPVPLSE